MVRSSASTAERARNVTAPTRYRRRPAGSARSREEGRRRYWSAEATRRSNALDLEADVFTLRDPREIALSLKRSAKASRRRDLPPGVMRLSMLAAPRLLGTADLAVAHR